MGDDALEVDIVSFGDEGEGELALKPAEEKSSGDVGRMGARGRWNLVF